MTEFVYQVDRVNDNLYFIGQINTISINELTKHIHNLEQEKSNSTNKCIKLYITSDGGNTREGLKLFDILQTTDLTLTIYISGLVCSAATLTLFTKHKVVMYKNALLCFHELSNTHNLSYSNAKAAIHLCDILMDKYLSIYNAKSNVFTKEWLVTDKYLTAQEALDMNLIDEVI